MQKFLDPKSIQFNMDLENIENLRLKTWFKDLEVELPLEIFRRTT